MDTHTHTHVYIIKGNGFIFLRRHVKTGSGAHPASSWRGA